MKVGDELRIAASWPAQHEARPPTSTRDGALPVIEGVDRLLPVTDRGELLGALSITKPPGDPLRPTEEKLANDLASQAGLVLRNVRLTAELVERLRELEASRKRIVTAQDGERRRIERNLHDGAQQQLVALQVKLSMAERLAEVDSPVRASLAALKSDVVDALENLRDLARGIYPPLLAADGLVRALSAQAGKAAIPIEIVSDGVTRHPPEMEAAVYFCCLEALQNVAKYSAATHAIVRLSEQGSHLAFEIRDDGSGFDATHFSYGTGLQGMADRLSALGGTLEIQSATGEGTTVVGTLPLTSV
jgi:signal transduction histidine kinase